MVDKSFVRSEAEVLRQDETLEWGRFDELVEKDELI